MNLEISQIQPQYCHLLVSYKKVLEQRNRYLKELCRMRPKDGLLSVLDEQLVQYGSMIIERRMNFVRQIDKMSGVLHAQITEDAELLRVEYASRLNLAPEDTGLERIADKFRARLEELRAAEIYRGVTLVGPQRDDLKFTVNNVDARVYGSQGQQRTIALSLRLAELDVMEDSAGEPPIVLLDDVMTDLDEDRRAHVFQMTQGRCQTFITAATRRAFETPFLDLCEDLQRIRGNTMSGMKYGSLLDLSAVVKDVLFRGELDTRVKEYTCIMVWDEVVGKQISSSAQPEFVRDGVMFVITKSSVWSNELTFYKKDMIANLNRRAGATVIRDLVFKVGKLPKKKSAAGIGIQDKPNLEGIKLSEDELEKIESVSSGAEGDASVFVKKLMITAAKLEKWKKSQGWTPCKKCGSLQRTSSGVCPVCEDRT